MDSSQLLRDLQQKNNEAFKTLIIMYGRPIYKRLLEKSGNRELAKQALKTALAEICATVSTSSDCDPLEALICHRAFEIQDSIKKDPYESAFLDVAENTDLFSTGVKETQRPEAASIAALSAASEPAMPTASEPIPVSAKCVKVPVHEAPEKIETVAEASSEKPEPMESTDSTNHTETGKTPAAPRRVSFGRIAAGCLLSCGILLTLWVIVGLVMDMGLIPDIDLGYSLFNANIAPWF